jgi:hypothetical protein
MAPLEHKFARQSGIFAGAVRHVTEGEKEQFGALSMPSSGSFWLESRVNPSVTIVRSFPLPV